MHRYSYCVVFMDYVDNMFAVCEHVVVRKIADYCRV